MICGNKVALYGSRLGPFNGQGPVASLFAGVNCFRGDKGDMDSDTHDE
jgi:hypothetical protein